MLSVPMTNVSACAVSVSLWFGLPAYVMSTVIGGFGRPGRGPDLRPGLVLAIEPMLMLGEEATRVLADDWTVVTADGSLAAHFEHTVAVTDDGAEVLTARG